jgi:hypothetical protein
MRLSTFSALSRDLEQVLTAGKDLMMLSVNGLKITSVHCLLNVKELKCP